MESKKKRIYSWYFLFDYQTSETGGPYTPQDKVSQPPQQSTTTSNQRKLEMKRLSPSLASALLDSGPVITVVDSSIPLAGRLREKKGSAFAGLSLYKGSSSIGSATNVGIRPDSFGG